MRVQHLHLLKLRYSMIQKGGPNMLPLEQSMTLNHLKVGPLTEICLMYNSTSVDSLHLRPKIHLGMCFCSQYISLKKNGFTCAKIISPTSTHSQSHPVQATELEELRSPSASSSASASVSVSSWRRCEEIPAKKIQLIQRDR